MITRPQTWKMTPEELEAYKHERAAAVMQALTEGKTLHTITGNGERDMSRMYTTRWLRIPAVWSDSGIKDHAKRFPEWGAEVARLSAINKKASHVRRGQQRIKNKTHCKNGHPYSEENTLWYKSKNTLSGLARHCKVCVKRRYNAPAPAPELIDRMKEAIAGGRTISSLYSIKGQRLINGTTLFTWFKNNPEEHKAILALSLKNRAVSLPKRRPLILAPYISAYHRPGNLLYAIAQHVPDNLPKDMRDDIINEVALQLVEGMISDDQIPQAVRAARNRSYREDHNGFKFRSLNEPAYRDNPTPLIETISSAQGLWS